MNRFIQWLKSAWKWMSGRKNHKLVVDSKCKDRCHCLCVYNEKNGSDDDSGSDISVHSPTLGETDIKVR